jgi:hypothetical protein
MLIFVGFLLILVAAAAHWAMLPKGGKVVWAATAPVLESVIPIGIVAVFATGVIFVISAL